MTPVPLERSTIMVRLNGIQAEVTPEELHRIITRHLKNIDTYCLAIKRLLKNPGKLGLTIT